MFKRIITLLLTVVFLLASAYGCNKEPDEKPELTFSDIEFSNYDPFRFYCYFTPPGANYGSNIYKNNPSYQTEEQYRYIAECGFNYAISVAERNRTERVNLLKGLAPYGTKVLVYDPHVWSLYWLYKQHASDSEIAYEKAEIKSAYEEYCQYDNFLGFAAVDEPTCKNAKYIEKAYQYYDSINVNNKEWWVNLLPNTSKEYLGASWEDYIDEYCKTSGSTLMSYDFYALYDNNEVSGAFWRYIEMFADVCRLNQKDFIAFILSIGHACGSVQYKAVKTYEDLAYQVYSYMMFGAKGIETFRYWSTMANESDCSNALISPTGERTSLYYGMQKLISEVRAFESIYMNSLWKGVMIYRKHPEIYSYLFDVVENNIDSYDRISKYEGTADFSIGVYEDRKFRDGFLVFNVNNPRDSVVNNIEITFNNAESAFVYYKGEKEKVVLDNGKFTITLDPCEACYVVPV